MTEVTRATWNVPCVAAVPRLAIEMVGVIVSPGDRLAGTPRLMTLSSGNATGAIETGMGRLTLLKGLLSTTVLPAFATRRT